MRHNIISNEEDLLGILKTAIDSDATAGQYYELTDNLDCSKLKDFAPLGNGTNYSFDGELDGKGHKIMNLEINTGETCELGLFNSIGRDGIVKNLLLESITIKQNLTDLKDPSKTTKAGMIAATCYGTISGCSASGEIILQEESNSCYAGGLCGYLAFTSSTISNSWTDVSISFKTSNTKTEETGNNNSYAVGGIVGHTNGIISACHSRSELSGPSDQIACYIAGGICGAAVSNAQVKACYNIGYLHSRGGESDALGGITGKADQNAEFSKCLYLNGCILSNSSQKTVKAFNTIGSKKNWKELIASGTAASELSEDYADTPADKHSYTPCLKIFIPEESNTLDKGYLKALYTPVASSFTQSVYPQTTNPVEVECELYNCTISKVSLTAKKPDGSNETLEPEVSDCSFSRNLGNNMYISYDFELTLTDDYNRSITIMDADIEMGSKKESMS